MASGYMTDEELELCHTVEQPSSTDLEAKKSANNIDQTNNILRNKTTNNENLNNVSSLPITESPYSIPTTVAESITEGPIGQATQDNVHHILHHDIF